MGKNKKAIKLIIPLLIIVVGLIIVISLTNNQPDIENMKHKKVLLIGMDGMDPKITSQLMQEGKLPNFQKLSKEGTFSNLTTSYPPHSPVAWTSIATGVNPGKHNIFDFIRRSVGSYLPELSLAKSVSGIAGTNYEPYVTATPFYKITSNNNIPTTSIRWPVSFPPERIQGNLLSGLGVPDIKGLLSGYTYYTTKNINQDNKNIQVNQNNKIIQTELRGPKTQKSGELIDITTPFKIKLDSNEKTAQLTINDQLYTIQEKQWSEWIQVECKISIFKKATGIFKAYLINSDQDNFKMYITTKQIDPSNPITPISSPEKYSEDLANEIGLYYTLGMPEETDGLIDEKIDESTFLEHIAEIESERDKMFWKEFENFKNQETGVYAFVYDSSDRVQHVFWEQKFIGNPNPKKIKLNPAVENYWIEKDKFIGQVLEKIDQKTLLLIVSDHGFTSFEKAVSINTILAKNNLIGLKGPIDETPLFRNVEWQSTRAYSLGFNSIYINLEGREPKGIVSKQNKEKIEDEIITKLEQLKDEDGNKAINKIYKASEIYSGDQLENAPDLIIGYNPGFRTSWQTAIGGFTKEVITINDKIWDGDHLVDPKFVPGVLFSNQKLKTEKANQLDIAPTILDSFNIEIPQDIDGKSLL